MKRFVKGSVGHPDHSLAHLTQGEGFGEMALIDDSPRMATVIALEDMWQIEVDKNIVIGGRPITTVGAKPPAPAPTWAR